MCPPRLSFLRLSICASSSLFRRSWLPPLLATHIVKYTKNWCNWCWNVVDSSFTNQWSLGIIFEYCCLKRFVEFVSERSLDRKMYHIISYYVYIHFIWCLNAEIKFILRMYGNYILYRLHFDCETKYICIQVLWCNVNFYFVGNGLKATMYRVTSRLGRLVHFIINLWLFAYL